MHPFLKRTIERIEQQFRADDRCLGIYLWGSAGKGAEDEYSDVDIAVVVRDEAYPTVKDELQSLCERLCGKIHAWLPEGEQDQFCNFAFLFEAGSELLLYDLSLMTGTFLQTRRSGRLDRILFDREGVLTAAKEAAHVRSYSPVRILPAITEYWVYAYLNGKYYRRSDVHKLLYVQSCLFQIHMRLLHALHPEADWTWWATSIKRLPPEKQVQMLVYSGSTKPEKIAAALEREFSLFSQDAQQACQAWSIDYPHSLEQHVRMHLRGMGLPIRKPGLMENEQ